MRIRKKPNLKARTERCAHLVINDPGSFRGRWLDEFGQCGLVNETECENSRFNELHIELGCGKGQFTVDIAIASSGVFHIALEKTADAMIIALERASAANLQNVRFINAYAERLSDFFEDGEASRIYINFCDPWPSNRHAKRRLTNRQFLELYSRILRPGGEVHFKTDNAPLFEYSLREFEYCGYELKESTRDLHKDRPVGIMTDYEKKFHSQGIPICRCVMRVG